MMLKKFITFLSFVLLYCSCSHNIERSGYIILESEISSDTIIQPFLPKKKLIINDNYVLEFNTELKGLGGNLTQSDTVSFFLIDTKKQNYTAYKTMSIKEKPFLRDKIENKRIGITFYSKTVDFFLGVNDLKIKDTIINSIDYKYATGMKITKESELFYEGYIIDKPHNFPVQISKILSEKTGGGFVEKINIFDKKNNKTITFKCRFVNKKLPKRIEKVMTIWAEN